MSQRKRGDSALEDGELDSESGEQELIDGTQAQGGFGSIKRSGKLLVLQAVLRQWSDQGHRVLLFTQGTKVLGILEVMMQREGYVYQRMDGTTPINQRQVLVEQFNADSNVFIFLMTSRVGGIGLNLTGANRVILFDPDVGTCSPLR